MIIIYGSTTYDFLSIAEGLKNQGLVKDKDYKIIGWRCFKMIDGTATKVYTDSPFIRNEYEHQGIPVALE